MRARHFSVVLLRGLVSAQPLATRHAVTASETEISCDATDGGGLGVDMTAAVQAIMPSSSSCAGADFPDECRTATQAAPFISEACADLSAGECAATIALMGLESVDMKYKHNVSPGRPGQGTANMMMANFVTQYATDLFGEEEVAGKTPQEVLAMVTPDDHNFASAAWFLRTHCDADVRSSLETGTDAGWVAYNQCIGVDGIVAERMEYWTRAKAAFHL